MSSKIKDLCYMGVSLALLILCSKISINIGPIPITFQTFGVIIISLILKWKNSAIVFLSYIVIGLIGIPVFSNGGGFDYILKPSFGFIIGFFFQSFIVGQKKFDKFQGNIFKAFLGLLIIDITGLIYMYFILNYYYDYSKNISYILSIGLTPFLLKDIISILLSTIIYHRIRIPLSYNIKESTKAKRDVYF